MSENAIEGIISKTLIGEAQKNALDFVAYLRANDMQIERQMGYWEDKYYFGVWYLNNAVCNILISNEEKTDPESWTFWSDDSGWAIFGDSSLDEKLKEIIWNHVTVCENEDKCFDSCKKSRRTIFGKEFDNVCGSAICFNNPDSEATECLKIIVQTRKNQLLTVQSRCGLLCDFCDYKKSHNCGGCIETGGHPFHGECPVAMCCQEKGYTHCGECDNLPGECADPNCTKIDANGFFECSGCENTSCDKLFPYSYKDPDHGDNPPGARIAICRAWANNKRKN